MIADILTKPLQGDLFRKLRRELVNYVISVTYEEGLETEDRTNNTVTRSRTKTNPNFQYPTRPKKKTT
jgi:hypothetical protein